MGFPARLTHGIVAKVFRGGQHRGDTPPGARCCRNRLGGGRYRCPVEADPAWELSRRVDRFRQAMSNPGAALDEMALALSVALQPALDITASLGELDALAAACGEPTRDGVMRHLLETCGFRGDDVDYHSWENSCLDRVLARRRGMPITLAVASMEVARRVGVPLVGVGMPGHFLIGDPHDTNWFADPFSSRIGLDGDDCRDLLRGLGRGHWSPHFLEPTPPRLIITRMLNNLRVSCEQRGDAVRLAIVMRLRAMMPELNDALIDRRRSAAALN
jgi:regulator of sirC expression with transglutaminase-like and TPR domain